MLKDRWTECIEVNVEEQMRFLPEKLFFLCHPTDLWKTLVNVPFGLHCINNIGRQKELFVCSRVYNNFFRVISGL